MILKRFSGQKKILDFLVVEKFAFQKIHFFKIYKNQKAQKKKLKSSKSVRRFPYIPLH